MQGIYLDNSLVTRPSEKVVSEMIPLYTERWGNPSAPHNHGQNLVSAIKESFRVLYHFLGAQDSDAIILTLSSAEAVNHVIASTYEEVTLSTGKNQFLTAVTDEAPALMAAGRLEKVGCLSTTIPVNKEGLVTVEALGDHLSPRTALLSLSWGNGLTGVVQPVEEIAALCRDRGVLLHLDASHVVGKIAIDWTEVPADYITFGGEQIHAPQGTAALFIRDGSPIAPFILGGMEQGGLRAGPISMAGLVGLSVACQEAQDSESYLSMEVARLRNKLEKGILAQVPEAVLFFQDQERLPHISVIAFPGVANEALLYFLNRQGIYASIGGGSFQQIGLQLEASGVDEPLAHSAVSFSLSRETTESEIDQAIVFITEAARELRRISGQLLEETL